MEKDFISKSLPVGASGGAPKYRLGGKEKRLSLGVYPDVSLKDARERRDDARKLLAQGIDPSGHRKAEKKASAERIANDFESVARGMVLKAFEELGGRPQ
jgi:hypothetical protein